MAYDDAEQLEAFRLDTRKWLEENCPPSMRTPMPDDEVVWGGRNATFKNPESKLWLDLMGEKGWTSPEWPKEYGGGGLSRAEARVLEQELRRIKARPPLFSFGLWMFGPALLEFGNHEQKLRFIPDILKGKIRWCQGYSEPGACVRQAVTRRQKVPLTMRGAASSPRSADTSRGRTGPAPSQWTAKANKPAA